MYDGTRRGQDHRRPVRALSDSAGALSDTFQRDAFGVRGATEGQSTQPFDFTGEVRDGETGFLYLRARMYDPFIGRFISRDPLAGLAARPTTLNRYSYAGNNPVNRRDPSGRAFSTGEDGGGCVDPACAEPVPFNQTTVELAARTGTPLPSAAPSSGSAPGAPAPVAGGSGSAIEPTVTCSICGAAVNLIRFGPGATMTQLDSGVIVVTNSTSGLFGGFAQRFGTFVPRSDLIVSRHPSIPADSFLMRHELGHIEQAREMGLGYLPSYVGNLVLTSWRVRTLDPVLIHRNHPMEIDADRRAMP